MFETDALYQNDPQWKNTKLGNQNKETIGSWGCLLTTMTMVANGYGFDETPKTINEKMKSAGGYQGALIIPAVLPSVCAGLAYKGYHPCEDSPAPITQIDAAIAAGKPVIAQVDWSPKANLQTHWIVLYDKAGDDYYMKDPYRYSGDSPDKKLKVLDRYKHSGKNISNAITGVIWIEGSTPTQPKPKVPLPGDSFTVYATVDGLALRSDPTISAVLIRRVPLHAQLETLESKTDVDDKIGVHGQWIHIQDNAGDQGYTAAWYVSKTVADEEEQTPEPPPATTPDDVEYYLVPIAVGLAVRSAPDYHAQLIKRVPLDTKFGYFESREEVNRKVGDVNEWIHVYDDSGLQGYTAAWYVTRKAGKAPAHPSDTTPPEQPPAEPKPPAPVEGFAVIPTIDGLAFRSSTTISVATLIRRLSLATTLSVEEPEDQAKQKIGVNGQWLKVKDASGQVGYIAAWYVKAVTQSDAGDDPTNSQEIIVHTTAEGVALRRSTQTADHTLIKRLPNNSSVVILEADAESKIGVYGKWLKVRDSSGTEGYMAAWYVEK